MEAFTAELVESEFAPLEIEGLLAIVDRLPAGAILDSLDMFGDEGRRALSESFVQLLELGLVVVMQRVELGLEPINALVELSLKVLDEIGVEGARCLFDDIHLDDDWVGTA